MFSLDVSQARARCPQLSSVTTPFTLTRSISSPYRLNHVAEYRKLRFSHKSRTIHTIPRIVAPIVAVMAQIYACLNAILRLSSVRSSRKSRKFHSRSSIEVVGSGIGIPFSSAVEVEGVRLMGE